MKILWAKSLRGHGFSSSGKVESGDLTDNLGWALEGAAPGMGVSLLLLVTTLVALRITYVGLELANAASNQKLIVLLTIIFVLVVGLIVAYAAYERLFGRTAFKHPPHLEHDSGRLGVVGS